MPGRSDAFAGIDVACAKQKRLPVSVVVRRNGIAEPLPLRKCGILPPLGAGNRRALDQRWRSEFVEATYDYLRALEAHFGITIRRIAIDAPSDPKAEGMERRRCERALAGDRIPYFPTPSPEEFEEIVRCARQHLDAGGRETSIPGANQLWMLVGFDLFGRLRPGWDECLEVFPHAIAWVLKASQHRKSDAIGCAERLDAARRHTGWPRTTDLAALAGIGFGLRHDKLDAYLSAWVASLEDSEREPLGGDPRDTIWLPRV